MSALDGFYAAWHSARETFGVGTPAGGARFDASATLRQLGAQVAAAAPGSHWSGSAATAYDRRNTEHRMVLDRLAESSRPVVRLRDQWVLIDPQEVRRARAQQDRKITPVDALGAALTGSTEIDGDRVEVHPTGWLAALRERLADPEAQQPVEQPAELAATLRDYQRRGLNWLARMTSLGLGCCGRRVCTRAGRRRRGRCGRG